MSSTNETDAGIEALMAAALAGGDDPRITTYALGEMEPAEKAAFEAELLARPELKQEVDRVRRLARTIEGELRADAAPVAGLPVEVRAKVVGPAPKPVIRWRTYLPHMAAAGLLGIVGLGSVASFKHSVAGAHGAAVGKIKTNISEAINEAGGVPVTIEGSTADGFSVDRADSHVEWTPLSGAGAAPSTEAVRSQDRGGRLEIAEGQAVRLRAVTLPGDVELANLGRDLGTRTEGDFFADPAARDATVTLRYELSSAAAAPGGAGGDVNKANAAEEARKAKERLSYALTDGTLDGKAKDRVRRLAEEAGQAERAGDARRAAELLEQAVAIAGTDPRVQESEAKARAEAEAEAQARAKEAERQKVAGLLVDLQRAIDAGPKDEAVRGTLAQARLLQERGELAQARELAREAWTRLSDLRAQAAISALDNPFKKASEESTGTFSIDVDTAGFAAVRHAIERGQLPARESVRIEELLNYFPYSYAPPTDGKPFASHVEVTACPWQPKHRLVRIGLKGKELAKDARPVSNLVFLIDVSGSMQEPQKLPLLVQSLTTLVDNLSEKDRVAIVVYAGASGLVLPSTTGDRKSEIIAALSQLQAGGGTNGGAGLELAYKVAIEHYITGGTNRVILCTDGDWNVGVSTADAVERLVAEKARSGVFLTCLGFFGSNYQDPLMERMADKGNGNYAAIDSLREAKKVLVEEMSGTLVTIAKDVKVQVEFNQEKVERYRLIGYENRVLANRDFADDAKDAGEIGAGHCVTALYEVEPRVDGPPAGDLLTLRLRWKKPDGQTSELLEAKVPDSDRTLGQASVDTRFAASVAAWGMLLRGSPHKGTASFALVEELGGDALGKDPGGHRAAWLELVKKSKALAGK